MFDISVEKIISVSQQYMKTKQTVSFFHFLTLQLIKKLLDTVTCLRREKKLLIMKEHKGHHNLTSRNESMIAYPAFSKINLFQLKIKQSKFLTFLTCAKNKARTTKHRTTKLRLQNCLVWSDHCLRTKGHALECDYL